MLESLQTLWAVSLGCRLSAECSFSAWWEKRSPPPPHTHTPMSSLGNKSPKVAMTCQFCKKLYQQRKEPAFELVMLHRCTNSLPVRLSCLFSRPEDPRSSALIGLWNVEKTLPAPQHSFLHCNLFVFQFSLKYWKVENIFLILQADHPEKHRTDSSLAPDCSQKFSEASEISNEMLKPSWIESQMQGHQVKYRAAFLGSWKVDFDDSTATIFLGVYSSFVTSVCN